MSDQDNKINQSQTGITKTILLIIFLAFITSVLLYFALFSKTNSPITQTKKINTNIAATTLEISSDLIKSSTASSYQADININTNTNRITSVQLELSFDPNIFTEIDITPGSFFDTPNIFLKNVDEINGRITYAIGLPTGEIGFSGKGIIAKINFSTPNGAKNISTSINFEPKTQVSGENSSSSLLKSSVGTSFILNKTAIITPSPVLIKVSSQSAN